MAKRLRVGVITGGGDCPGLNAVIRAVAKSLIVQHNAEVLGFEDGFQGLIEERIQPLNYQDVSGILTLGGTILGTSNKANPFSYYRRGDADVSSQITKFVRTLGMDALVVIGGDGTMSISHRLQELGINIVGVPKTIDNDLVGTDYTFGYQTAVQVACDALDRLHTTGESHQRVMILEVMGRDAGWIALEAGIAGRAHTILIPEIPYQLEKVLEKIHLRKEGGSPFSIIVVAEGAKEIGKDAITSESASNRLQGVAQLGGVGYYVANEIGKRIDLEVRCTVLGHTQRGGTPLAFDRVLGTRLGTEAVQAAADKKFGNMVALQGREIIPVPLKSLAGIVRQVPLDSQLIGTAESIGICLGR